MCSTPSSRVGLSCSRCRIESRELLVSSQSGLSALRKRDSFCDHPPYALVSSSTGRSRLHCGLDVTDPTRSSISWLGATVRGLVIFFYFVLATVWLPDFVLSLSAVADASRFIRDLVGLTIWGAGLVAGLWMLRFFQSKEII